MDKEIAQNFDYELDWDDEIENDSPDYILLADGDYDFEVVDFEKGMHNGSEKLPPCKKAILHIRIAGKDANGREGITTIKHQLFLHSRTEGMLCAFFNAIGERKPGEKVKMNWSAVPGSRGRCKVGQRSYKDKDTGEMKGPFNEVKKFYEKEGKRETPVTGPQTSFKAGEF